MTAQLHSNMVTNKGKIWRRFPEMVIILRIIIQISKLVMSQKTPKISLTKYT